MQEKKKILIIRLTSLGDVIFTLPLANALKSAGHTVHFLTAEKGAGVIFDNPTLEKTFLAPLAKWRKNRFSLENLKEFFALIKQLRAENYDIALDCQQMFKSLALFMFCGAKRRITFKDAREFSALGANEFVTPRAPFRSFDYHIVERNLDFARYLGLEPAIKFSLPETSQDIKAKVDELLKPLGNKPFVVIAPATTWANKHWAEKNWLSLVEKLSKTSSLVFTGTSADTALLERLGADRFINLTGKTDFKELQEVLSRASLVISPDSGTAHLAWATGNPAIVTIFTCTPQNRFAPFGEKYKTVSGKFPCQPCFKKKCKTKTLDCCAFPTTDEVFETATRYL